MKKVFALALILLLTFAGSFTAYASNPLSGLDNQGETEGTAGITWDQINEMSQNSPNSLSPIQGLVLWMFSIIAFLKLAQKMDDLLQKLGFNVTQTGGRALGDLVVAGMALKNVGNALSKGMGMLGFGGGKGGGGTSGGSSGTGGGPAPIPAGGPGGSTAPAGSSPGGTSPGGRTAPGGAPTGTTPTGTAPAGSPSSSPAASSDTGSGAATNRNAVGRAVDWMRGDGVAQGAVRAGAKGGLIGLGAYSAKTGAAKIGSAVSTRLGGGMSSSPQDEGHSAINNPAANGRPPGDSAVNPEEFQASRPLDGNEVSTSIPASVNTEDFQDTGAAGGDGASNGDYSSYSDEGYHETGTHDSIADSQPIPAAMDAGQEADTVAIPPASADANNETWQDAAQQDGLGGAPISAMNDEGWQDSGISAQPSTFDITADEAGSVPMVQDATVMQDASAQTGSSVVQGADSVPADGPDNSAAGGGAFDTTESSGDGQEHEPAPTPMYNHAIPGAASTGTVNEPPAANPFGVSASFDSAAQTPVQSGGNAVGASTDSPPPATPASGTQPTQAQSSTEVIRTESSAPTQAQGTVAAVAASDTRQNTTVQSHTTQVNNVTRTELPNQPQPAVQPAVQSSAQNNTRPTAKGQSKNPSVKGRKRKR